MLSKGEMSVLTRSIFILLFFLGLVLINESRPSSANSVPSSTAPQQSKDPCLGLERCWPPLNCYIGMCVYSPNYTCGGACGVGSCPPNQMPCTCYYYDGTCTWDQSWCQSTCCTTDLYCF